MRKYTLLLSVTVHVAAALTLVIAPLFAAARLPDILESISWVPARVATPPPLGDRSSSKPQSKSNSSATLQPQLIPVEAPSTMPDDPGIVVQQATLMACSAATRERLLAHYHRLPLLALSSRDRRSASRLDSWRQRRRVTWRRSIHRWRWRRVAKGL